MTDQDHNPRQLIEDIRREWRVEELESGGGDNFVELARNTLPLLTDELYESSSHFLSELIQNADDNAYPEGVLPTFEIVARESEYTIANNEIGFQSDQVRAICSAGKSTKADRKHDYTGEKGIGFKAVFQVSDRPEIHSNGYHFRFDRNQYEGLGSIIPEWSEGEEDEDQRTRIILPARNEYIPLDFAKRLRPELLLFLRRLRCVELIDVDWERRVKLSRSDNGQVVHVSETIQDDYRPGRNRENEHQFRVHHQRVEMDDIEEPRRRAIKATQVASALSLDSHGNVDASRDRQIFAFLPVRESSLPFLIHADFVLSTSRDTVREGLPWNIRLRDALGDCLAETILECRNQAGPGATALRVLVDPERMKDRFLAPILERTIDTLRNSQSVPTTDNGWVLPEDALIPDRNELWQLVSEPDALALLGSRYVQPQLNGIDHALKLLGVRTFSMQDILKCFADEDWRARLSVDWFANLYTTLARAKLSKKELDLVRKAPVLRLRNERLMAPTEAVDDDPVFIDLEQQTEYGFEDGLALIDPDVLRAVSDDAQEDVRNFLNTLGVRKADPSHVIEKYILPIHKGDRWKSSSDEALIGHLHYIRDHFEEYPQHTHYDSPDLSCLRIRVEADNSAAPRYAFAKEMYIGPEYGTKYDLRRLFGESAINEFISADYLEREHLDGSDAACSKWRDLFKQLQADAIPPIYKDENDDSAWGEDVITLLRSEWSERKHDLLNLINEWWTDYYRQFAYPPRIRKPSSMLVELGQTEVPTTNDGAAPLRKTYANNEENRSTFGTAVPYLDPTLFEQLTYDLGVVQSPTVESVLERLQSLSGTSDASSETLQALYAFLDQRFKEHAKTIHSVFKTARCIGVPIKDQMAWRKSEECCWTAEKQLYELLDVTAIGGVWESFEEFFVNRIEVKKEPAPDSYVAALDKLQDVKDESEYIQKRTQEIYRRLAPHCKSLLETEDDPPEWGRRLSEEYFLLTTHGEWCRNEDDVFLADDPDLARLFEETSEVAFVHVPRSEHTTLRAFFKWLQVEPLSDAISVKPRLGLEGQEWPDLRNRIVERGKILARYLHHKHHQLFTRARKDGTLQRLFNIVGKIYEPLELDVQLNDLSATAPFDIRLDSSGDSWILQANSVASTYWTEIAIEIARGLEMDEDAGCVLGQLLGETIDNAEKLLKSMKVYDLPEEIAADLFGDAANEDTAWDPKVADDTHLKQPAEPTTEDRSPQPEPPTTDAAEQQVSPPANEAGPEDDTDFSPVSDHPARAPVSRVESTRMQDPGGDDAYSDEARTAQSNSHDEGGQAPDENASRTDKAIQETPAGMSANDEHPHAGTGSDRDRERIDDTNPSGHSQVHDRQKGARQGVGNDMSRPQTPLSSTRPTMGKTEKGSGTGERLRSYVSPPGEIKDEAEEGTEWAERIREIELAAIRHVMDWEKLQKRVPEDANIEVPHQHGYDIISRDASGAIERYIEVKGLAGKWNRRGVMVTPSQFEFSRRHTHKTWLYIVEYADSDDPVIHRIQNFAGRVWRFGFDGGWAQVGENDPIDIPRS